MHRLTCRCGQVQGHVITGQPSARVRCYCTDCQAFGRFLGSSAEVLDAQGGTEIVQVCQSRLRFDRGIEQLAAVRLTEKGMIRWYAQCCRTPIGNTMQDPKMSFVGLIHSFLDASSLDDDFGSSVALLNTNTALGEPKPRQRGLIGVILKFARLVLASRIRGRYKQSPLYSSEGRPVVPPEILAAAELQRLKTAA
jgi:hypothetical protein